MINWLIYIYNIASVPREDRNASYFNSSGNVYMTLQGDSATFTAQHWNLMRSIANAAARKLGGNNFLNTEVHSGDLLTAQIFFDVTDNINNLIDNY